MEVETRTLGIRASNSAVHALRVRLSSRPLVLPLFPFFLSLSLSFSFFFPPSHRTFLSPFPTSARMPDHFLHFSAAARFTMSRRVGPKGTEIKSSRSSRADPCAKSKTSGSGELSRELLLFFASAKAFPTLSRQRDIATRPCER